MATLLVGPTRTYTTIQSAINVTSATNDNPASRAAMDLILVDAGTYTETLDLRAGWLLPVIIRGADAANRPIIASTGAAQAVRADSVYRGTAVGELTLEDLIFSGWTAAGNGVIYTTTSGLVVRRVKFTGCTSRVIRSVRGTATRYGIVDSCEFSTSGLTTGLILGDSAYTDVINCKAVCPTNVPFYSDLGGASRNIEHNSILGTWNSGGNTDVITVTGGTARGNVLQNLGTGARYGIYEFGAGSYIENVLYGTFATNFFGTDGGGNQVANPLFTNTGTGDLTLQGASPAIRSTARSATSLLTITGATRSDPTDAGAYEAVLDAVAPTLLTATMTSASTIVLVFSEALATAAAQTGANYVTSPTRAVTAGLSPSTTVTLTLSSATDSLQLTIGAGVTDLAGNAFVARTLALSYSAGALSGEVAYTVSDSGGKVEGFAGWDPLPAGPGTEATLERLVFASLFSDARLTSDLRPPDGTGDRRGWHGDTYTGAASPAASLLWWLQGSARATPRAIEDAVKSALQWMIAAGVCDAIKVTASVVGNRADVVVEMVAKDQRSTLAFQDLWGSYA